jgi:hypothetical protein
MIRVYKAPKKRSVGWNDYRGGYSTKPTFELLYKRLIEDTDTGELSEFTNDYLHGASDRYPSLQSHEAL